MVTPWRCYYGQHGEVVEITQQKRTTAPYIEVEYAEVARFFDGTNNPANWYVHRVLGALRSRPPLTIALQNSRIYKFVRYDEKKAGLLATITPGKLHFEIVGDVDPCAPVRAVRLVIGYRGDPNVPMHNFEVEYLKLFHVPIDVAMAWPSDGTLFALSAIFPNYMVRRGVDSPADPSYKGTMPPVGGVTTDRCPDAGMKMCLDRMP